MAVLAPPPSLLPAPVTLQFDAQPSVPGARLELVRQIRAEIAAGTYPDARQLDLAIDRLVAAIHGRVEPT